jgi:regulator of protease activity HflC (stomatin/prohibitin superfamily)
MERWPRQVSRWLPQLTLAGAVLILVAAGRPLRLVGNGENMVLFTWGGGVSPTPLQPGLHWVPPFVSRTVTFDVKTQALTWKDNDPTAYAPRLVALSQDGQQIAAEATLQFRIVDAPKVYTQLGENYLDRIAPIVRSVILNETSGFSAQALYSTERPVLQGQIRERVALLLKEYGIEVLDFLLRDIDFDPDFVAAIEAKTIAENELVKKQYEIEQARQEARAIISQAEAEAGQLQAKAEALTRNPQYLEVVKAAVLGSRLETLVTK